VNFDWLWCNLRGFASSAEVRLSSSSSFSCIHLQVAASQGRTAPSKAPDWRSPLCASCLSVPPKPFCVTSFTSTHYMVYSLNASWTGAHGAFHDADPSQITLLRHDNVYDGSYAYDHSIVVKTFKPRQKLNHTSNRVSISFHITTIQVTLPTIQQPYPIRRKKIRWPNRCKPLYTIVCTFTYDEDSHHVNFILIVLQPQTFLLDFIPQWVSAWRILSSRQSFIKELMLSARIRNLSGQRALIWIKAIMKIADIFGVSTLLISLRHKLDLGPAFQTISMKNQWGTNTC
jgi:hypothetical protein